MNEVWENTCIYTDKYQKISMDEYKNDIINSLKDNRDFFDHAQNRYKRIFVQAFLHQIDEYLNDMQRSGWIEKFIDIWCGKWFITNYIQKYIDTNGWGLGIDISPEKIHFSQNIFPDTKYMLQDTQSIEKNGDIFDLVVCTEVLEHLDHPEDMLTVCKNLSTKYVLISVPSEPYFSMASLITWKNISRRGTTPDHKKKYNKKSLSRFLHMHLSWREITVSTRWFWLLAYCKKNTTL